MFVAIDVFVVVRNVLLLYTFVETSYHHTEDVTPKQITPNIYYSDSEIYGMK